MQSGTLAGTVTGNAITFHVEARRPIDYTGPVDGDSMKGTLCWRRQGWQIELHALQVAAVVLTGIDLLFMDTEKNVVRIPEERLEHSRSGLQILFGMMVIVMVGFLLGRKRPDQQTPTGGRPQRSPSTTQSIRPIEPPQVLQQFNSALEGLVARISPAVVQVLVTGYGPMEDKDTTPTLHW